jgi:branched-chain amino acid transport system permease protein
MLQEIFSADPRSIHAGDFATASIQIVGGIAVGALPLAIFAIALAAAASLQWVFLRTSVGRVFRATSDDRETAELMGLDARLVYAAATALAFALIALAGLLQGMRTTVAPADGPALLLYAFEAVVIGGLGSFWGTFAGGIILGVTQAIGFRLDPGWGIWLGHVVFLIVLLVRPEGLFPRMR